jgi:hypothetical protein
MVFTTVYAVAYSLTYYNEWALFRYYPLVGEVFRAPQLTTLGPYMVYYSWVATSVAVAGLAALLVPARRVADSLLGRSAAAWAWAVPLAATLFMFVYETRWIRHWFG